MTKLNNTLTLLNGSRIVLNSVHSALVPEVVLYEEEAPLILQNDKHEYLGTAEITDVKVETFALLQNKDLEQTSHDGTKAWPNALTTLVEQVPGFSQLDKVSIVTFFVHEVSGSGLTVNASDLEDTGYTVGLDLAVVEPSEEEQYAGLATVGEIEDADGNEEVAE